MIFLFCVDTSASMNQRATNGMRLIDAAKAGVEYFMLKRATDVSYSNDRFFLVTFEEGPSAIKVCYYSPHSFLFAPFVASLNKSSLTLHFFFSNVPR